VEGPIYGERIERYGSTAEAERRVQLVARQLDGTVLGGFSPGRWDRGVAR
jgi:hypothetical protein